MFPKYIHSLIMTSAILGLAAAGCQKNSSSQGELASESISGTGVIRTVHTLEITNDSTVTYCQGVRIAHRLSDSDNSRLLLIPRSCDSNRQNPEDWCNEDVKILQVDSDNLFTETVPVRVCSRDSHAKIGEEFVVLTVSAPMSNTGNVAGISNLDVSLSGNDASFVDQDNQSQTTEARRVGLFTRANQEEPLQQLQCVDNANFANFVPCNFQRRNRIAIPSPIFHNNENRALFLGFVNPDGTLIFDAADVLNDDKAEDINRFDTDGNETTILIGEVAAKNGVKYGVIDSDEDFDDGVVRFAFKINPITPSADPVDRSSVTLVISRDYILGYEEATTENVESEGDMIVHTLYTDSLSDGSSFTLQWAAPTNDGVTLESLSFKLTKVDDKYTVQAGDR